MRRLKKEHYDGLRTYAKHYSDKDFRYLIEHLESLEPQYYYCVPIVSAPNGQCSKSTVVRLPQDAFEEVGQ